jgi:hypothetical protein
MPGYRVGSFRCYEGLPDASKVAVNSFIDYIKSHQADNPFTLYDPSQPREKLREQLAQHVEQVENLIKYWAPDNQ